MRIKVILGFRAPGQAAAWSECFYFALDPETPNGLFDGFRQAFLSFFIGTYTAGKHNVVECHRVKMQLLQDGEWVDRWDEEDVYAWGANYNVPLPYQDCLVLHRFRHHQAGNWRSRVFYGGICADPMYAGYPSTFWFGFPGPYAPIIDLVRLPVVDIFGYRWLPAVWSEMRAACEPTTSWRFSGRHGVHRSRRDPFHRP